MIIYVYSAYGMCAVYTLYTIYTVLWKRRWCLCGPLGRRDLSGLASDGSVVVKLHEVYIV